ncbi:hypothetical protein TcCL_NonESM08175 [Trypanosoma cruzi]|nr:hypothetical protein TcCL_NonESM08175 [Trypanosoma cruzi]
MRGRHVRVCTREQHSRKQLASAGAPQGGVLLPQLSLRHVCDVLRRMENIYSASAFMYTDEHTLVASGADIHACAAAMPPALSPITTWAVEHNLKINVDKSESALFYISSHTHGLTRTWSISFLAMGDYAFSHAQCACWATRSIVFLILITHASTDAKQTMPRRYQLRPVAQAGASHHNTQSFSIGYGHGV